MVRLTGSQTFISTSTIGEMRDVRRKASLGIVAIDHSFSYWGGRALLEAEVDHEFYRGNHVLKQFLLTKDCCRSTVTDL